MKNLLTTALAVCCAICIVPLFWFALAIRTVCCGKMEDEHTERYRAKKGD